MIIAIIAFIFSFVSFASDISPQVDSASLIVYRTSKEKDGFEVLIGTKGLINYYNIIKTKRDLTNNNIKSLEDIIARLTLKPALKPTFLGGKLYRETDPKEAALREFFEETFLSKHYPSVDYAALVKKITMSGPITSEIYKNKFGNSVVSHYYLVHEDELKKNNISFLIGQSNQLIFTQLKTQSFNRVDRKNIPEIITLQWIHSDDLEKFFSSNFFNKYSEIDKLAKYLVTTNSRTKKWNINLKQAKNKILKSIKKHDYKFKVEVAKKISNAFKQDVEKN